MKYANHFTLFQVFGSHMVLQREEPIVISGTAAPGSSVKVAFAGQELVAAADGTGEWQAKFPAMPAGGPWILTVSGAPEAEKIVLEDILIGEVWLCSGQSNMEMPIASVNPFYQTLNAQEEVKNADHPQIRLYNMSANRRLAPDAPLDDVAGLWQPCTPETAEAFSACGYFFGRSLQAELNVPVGLIANAWGGTDIAAWISRRMFEKKHWHLFADTEESQQKKWQALLDSDSYKPLWQWIAKFNAVKEFDPALLAPEFDDSGWQLCDRQVTELPEPGRYICRFSFELPESAAGKDLLLNCGIINDADRTYFNGKLIGVTGVETPESWNTIRKYPVPGSLVKAGKNLLVIAADDYYVTGSVSTGELKFTADGMEFSVMPQCRIAPLFTLPPDFPARPDFPPVVNRGPGSPNYPSTLFNAAMYPWRRCRIRGVIWYQGCHNDGELTYYPLHKMLIDDLRELWNNPAMPFLLVQLASYYKHAPENPVSDEAADAVPFPEYPPYAVTREIQAEMPKVRNHVGMIAAFDRGDHSDIHPRDKQTLGFRLAQKAMTMVYGKDALADGPEFAGFRQEKDRIRVFFRNTGDGLRTSDGEAPRGFVLGDRTGKLCRATAVIEEDSVVLHSPEIAEPQRVRYAFTGYCRVNLINSAALPALPFRSDKNDYENMFAE